MGQSWTGDIDFSQFGEAGSTTTLVGANGGSSSYLPATAYAQDFVLRKTADDGTTYAYGLMVNDGFSLSNSNPNQKTTFSGKFSGDGLFLVDRSSRSGITDKFCFTGDISAFAGGFEVLGTTAQSSLHFSDNAGTTVYANENCVLGSGAVKISASAGPDGNNAYKGYALEFDYAKDHGAANEISGTGTVRKSGAGTLTLTGDIRGLTGEIQIAEGGLTLSGDRNVNTSVSGAGTLGVKSGTAEFALNNFSGVTLSDSFTLLLSDATVAGMVAENYLSTLRFVLSDTACTDALTLALEVAADDVFMDVTEMTALTEGSNTVIQLTLATIPEPSGFGLIAGVGALVFAAARRRRKKS